MFQYTKCFFGFHKFPKVIDVKRVVKLMKSGNYSYPVFCNNCGKAILLCFDTHELDLYEGSNIRYYYRSL